MISDGTHIHPRCQQVKCMDHIESRFVENSIRHALCMSYRNIACAAASSQSNLLGSLGRRDRAVGNEATIDVLVGRKPVHAAIGVGDKAIEAGSEEVDEVDFRRGTLAGRGSSGILAQQVRPFRPASPNSLSITSL